jgi:hypothetical protein
MWDLHSVVVHKNAYNFDDAKDIARRIIDNPERRHYRTDTYSYRFNNIPKEFFSKFRSHIVNDGITLIYGRLKKIN